MKCLAMINSEKSIFFGNQSLLLPDGRKIPMPSESTIKRRLGKIRLMERLFRLEPRCTAFLGTQHLVMAYQRKIWIVDIHQAEIQKVFSIRNGFSDVLSFCQMEDAVYFGDYGNNLSGESIHIYQLDIHQNLNIVYTFPARSIKHIHGLIYDRWRNRFFIFTGDQGTQAGIYTASADFSCVEPFLTGSQQYRTVVGHVTEKYLYYTTDAVMEPNFLYRVELKGEKKPQKLASLNGSVIFGLNLEDGFLLSTTVEPYPIKKSALLSLLDNRRGKGILSSETMVGYVDETSEITWLKAYHKDRWLMRLFQYGSVQFPALLNHQVGKYIYVNPMAVAKYDGKPQKLDLTKCKKE